jgi:Flp pilus assembly protein TadD
VVQIIPICKLSIAPFALAIAATLSPAHAAARPDSTMDSYVAARLAEISQENQLAQSGYAKLLTKVPNSATLADRLFASAIRSGDIANALKAVRAQELQNKAVSEAPLLLFADAFKRKNWDMARLASTELAARTQYGFLTPILNTWVNVAQKMPASLSSTSNSEDKALAYFAMPQQVYLKLALGQMAEAKAELKLLQSVNADFIQDLNIRAAPLFAASGDGDFATALISAAFDGDTTSSAVGPNPATRLTANEALAALHIHVANSLLAQKQPEQALIFARIAEYYAPSDIATQVTLGNAMSQLGIAKRAQSILAAVPNSSPYWTQAVTTLAGNFSNEKRFADAALLIGKARRQRPRSVSLALLAAQNFEQTNNLAAAASIYKELSQSADQSKTAPAQAAIFRMFWAGVLEKQGDWAGSKGLLQSALKLDPRNPYILNSLGYSMLEHKEDPIAAIELLKKARGLAPESAAIADSLGWAYVTIGDVAKAIPLLEIAARSSGNDLTINEHLGDAYWLAGRKIDARYAWKVALLTAESDPAARLAKKIDLGLDVKRVSGKS